MKFKVNGISVNTFGESNHPAIIFIHGFPYDHTMWEDQIEYLKDEFYCIAYDVRGLGESAVGDGQYTMEGYTEDLFAVMKELKLKRPAVCGLSMGGYIALRAVEKAMDHFSALILCDTKAEADDNAAKLKRAAGIAQINSGEFIKFVDAFVTNCFAEESIKEEEKMFHSVLHRSQKNDPLGVKGALIAILSRTDTTPFLSQITIPTLVLCGSYDKLTPPVLMRAMAEHIPGSEYAVIPRSGHMSPLENPDAVDDLLYGFLKRIEK